MDSHIGKKGSLIAGIVHDDPDAIEAYVKEIRERANSPHIDWYYIVKDIALIKAIGDLPHIRNTAKVVLPGQRTTLLEAVA
ncbi:MAG: hypothetical protein Q8O51_00170 [bacterium]|nr:hypothetical protein [bacterium]